MFWGIAPATTATVTLDGPGSQRLAVPLSPVSLPGRVAFVVRVPGRMLRPGGAPTALVARNAAGAVIARQTLSVSSFTPSIYNRSSPSGSRPSGPIISTGTLLELQIGPDTHRYSLQSENGRCLQDDLSAPTGPETDIVCGPPTAFASPYIAPVQNRVALIWGKLPRGADTVTVVYAGHSNPTIVSHGYYFGIVTTEQLRSADLPLRAVARTRSGTVRAVHAFQRSDFPGY